MVWHEMTMFGNDLMIQFTLGHSDELCRHKSELYLKILSNSNSTWKNKLHYIFKTSKLGFWLSSSFWTTRIPRGFNLVDILLVWLSRSCVKVLLLTIRDILPYIPSGLVLILAKKLCAMMMWCPTQITFDPPVPTEEDQCIDLWFNSTFSL